MENRGHLSQVVFYKRGVIETHDEVWERLLTSPVYIPIKRSANGQLEHKCEQMYHDTHSKESSLPVRVLRGRRSTDYRVAYSSK